MSTSSNPTKALTALIETHGATTLYTSLKFVHRCALYQSNIIIQESEKEELFHVQQLMDVLEEFAKKEERK